MRCRQPEAVKNNVNILNVPVSSKRSNVAVEFLTSYEQKLFLRDFFTNTCTSGSDTNFKDSSCSSPTSDSDDYRSTSDSTDLDSNSTQSDNKILFLLHQ